MQLRGRAWLVPTALALVACGGGSQQRPSALAEGLDDGTTTTTPRSTGPSRARGENEVVARIGRSGGVLELANGARLEIPEGALEQEVEIRFHVSPPAREAWNDETKRPLGPMLEVTPSITSSSGEFRVSCPATQIPHGWEPSDLALGHEEEQGTSMGGSTQTRWQMWPARVEGNRFVAEIPYFHGHRFQFGVSRLIESALAEIASGADATEIARRAGVPREAVELAWSCEVIDLHLESFIPPRLWGYDLLARNRSPFGGLFFGHLDVPRALEGGLTGAMWSIATNVARGARGRPDVLERNCAALRATLERSGKVEIVRSAAEYRDARRRGMHAALLSVQGGNAVEGAEERLGEIAGGALVRITVVHLSSSTYGDTSSPLRLRGDQGLTDRGRDLVRRMNEQRMFVDLAHVSPRGFWDAVEVHDKTQPLIDTHTGASAIHPMWRNVDDRQIKAIADTGGVVGAIFHSAFLGARGHEGRAVIDHLEAIIRAGGEESAALGSDYDGMIVPPADLRDGATAYYRLVSYMLERKWREERIRGVLGGNFLESFARLRP